MRDIDHDKTQKKSQKMNENYESMLQKNLFHCDGFHDSPQEEFNVPIKNKQSLLKYKQEKKSMTRLKNY